MLAFANSLIPLSEYSGGHVAPVVQVIRQGARMAVPSKYIDY
jgi:hypothetical protein